MIPILIGLILLVPAVAAAEAVIDPPAIAQTVHADGQTATILVDPHLTIEGQPGRLRTRLALDTDMADFQRRVPAALDGVKRDEPCGQWVEARNTRLVSAGGGQARLTTDIGFKQRGCQEIRVPEVVCKGFDCKVGQRIEIAKAESPQLDGSVDVDIRPAYRDQAFVLDLSVAAARLGGIPGEIVKVLHLEDELRKLAQDALAAAMQRTPLATTIPDAYRPADLVAESLEFYDRGGGALGLKAVLSGSLTKEQVIALAKLLNTKPE